MHSDIKDVASLLDPSHWYSYRIIIIMIPAFSFIFCFETLERFVAVDCGLAADDHFMFIWCLIGAGQDGVGVQCVALIQLKTFIYSTIRSLLHKMLYCLYPAAHIVLQFYRPPIGFNVFSIHFGKVLKRIIFRIDN